MEMTKQQETKEKLTGLSSNGYYGTGGSGDLVAGSTGTRNR
jgi:hypothetical protein